ncbi:MAG TPA: DHA2 family efflux MFS transporter permease subunit [Gemmatimonadaceae bacterium]|jgi:DHA2 family multidrug resistance protein
MSDDRYKWRVLGVVVFGVFMVVLDTTVVNVAFPTMREQFHASLALSQWIVSLYVLSLGIVTPIAGYLSDRFGIKRTYLAGLALFALGSLGSGLSPSLITLLITRAIQGIGGGVALPLGTAMLFGAFPPEEQGLALGLYGVALLVAPALGPILGGYLVDRDLWRWIFFINVPVGAIGVGLGIFLLREHKQKKKPKADPWGVLTSIVGFGSLLYAASIGADVGWSSRPVQIAAVLGVVGLAAFIFVELKVAEDPLLDFDLFKRGVFLNASLVGWVTVMALFGAEFLMPIYLQMVRGRTAFQTGLILLPLAATAAITTPIVGRIYDRIGPRALVVLGFSVLAVNTWQLSQLTGTTGIRWILFLMALRGFALGNTVQSTFATALGTVAKERVSRGSSLINSTRFVVQSIAVAIFASIVATSQSSATRQQQAQLQQMPSDATRGVGLCEVTKSSTAVSDSTGASKQKLSGIGSPQSRACTETMHGFESAYRITFWFALLALALALFLPGWPFGWEGRKGLQEGAGSPQHDAAA